MKKWPAQIAALMLLLIKPSLIMKAPIGRQPVLNVGK